LKILLQVCLVMLSLTFYCCSEDTPIDQNPTGKLLIKSNPQGAQIYLKGMNTGKITPTTIENLEPGNYDGFIFLQYYDTAFFAVNVFSNTTTTIDTILTDGLPFVEFIFDFQISFNDDSVRFNFTINQDVTMDSIAVMRPVDVTGTSITDLYLYNEELFEFKDVSGNLKKYYLPPSGSGLQYYPAIQNRDYYFSMFGHKAYGAKVEFRSYYQVGL
jgi:hypothetical protein